MAKVNVAWGPPGKKGVEFLMGIGADDYPPDPTKELLTKVGWISVGAWAVGTLFGSKALRQAALGGAAASFGVRYLAGRDLAK
jgi:hypothetical protein